MENKKAPQSGAFVCCMILIFYRRIFPTPYARIVQQQQQAGNILNFMLCVNYQHKDRRNVQKTEDFLTHDRGRV